MVELKFTEEMIRLLSRLKGETLLSYSYDKHWEKVVRPECYIPSSYWKTRLGTTIGEIDLINEENVHPWFGGTEGIAGFACKIVKNGEPLDDGREPPAYVQPVNKRIVGIEIINDVIVINKGEYSLTFDQALIFRFEDGSVLMFSRDVWFSEEISITWHDDYDKLFSIEQLTETLNDEGDDQVEVTRTRRAL
ncbi:MAG: hypothetical protein E7473_09970 [Ruminococcaceae bacterium]|nr:hypothetical protein [Oscillospiraceae bacterium]